MEPAGYSVYSHSMTSNFNHDLNLSNLKNEVLSDPINFLSIVEQQKQDIKNNLLIKNNEISKNENILADKIIKKLPV
jgi:hypothetical protein